MSGRKWKVGDEVFVARRLERWSAGVDRSRVKRIDKDGVLTLEDRCGAWGFGVRVPPCDVFPSEQAAWAGLAETYQKEAASFAQQAEEADARATECRDRALALAVRR